MRQRSIVGPRVWWVAVFGFVVASFGCQSATPKNECDGAVEEMDGRSYCVRRKSEITETGFQCPSSHPYRQETEDLVVCSKGKGEMPEEHEEKIVRRHGEGGSSSDAGWSTDTGEGGSSSDAGKSTDTNAIYLTDVGGDGGSRYATSGSLKFQHVSSGYDQSCAVTVDGEVKCWGDFTQSLRRSPWGSREYQAADVSFYSGCGIRSGGTVEC